MLLRDKTAVIYGGGGAVGGAMAQAFAAEGARCFLVGRTPAPLEAVARRIREAGGHVETAVLDAHDTSAVDDHADAVAGRSGSLDISVNLIVADAIFQPLSEISVPDFGTSIARTLTAQLTTTKAAARHMAKQGSGVLLFFGGSDYRAKIPGLGTVQIAMDAVEALRRQWAVELGPHGVRVLSLLTGGVPETFPEGPEQEPYKQALVDATLLKRAATLADVGRVAAFLASDQARTMTATQVNISAGAHGD
ncbi:SDR family NAD(P)-dependent oxidoreductase [Yinghuangia soli]|uniref:SDR family oxidoreductase n=1 Tax=Yinghuangia soli TaxID=2908204 RepID=A0AA41Q3J4_9ACTN|nr:SDR family oxidoreductase [Yinghuangia soli]MCF2530330.1 SDR family oxidoreductase [Yinghuangia soli]